MFASVFRSVTLILSFLLIACLSWRTAAADEQPVLLVLGDSLSAAYGMELNQSWVALLQERLEKHNTLYHVINASVSGDTSRTALNRLKRNQDKYSPDLCLVELGGNDGLQGLQAAELKDNLTGIIDTCLQTARHVFLFEIQIPMNYGPTYRDRLMNVYLELASRDDVTLVPFFLENIFDEPGLMQADGIHPTASAQSRLLENVWPSIEPYLQAGAP